MGEVAGPDQREAIDACDLDVHDSDTHVQQHMITGGKGANVKSMGLSGKSG